jgi:hypothetical protein
MDRVYYSPPAPPTTATIDTGANMSLPPGYTADALGPGGMSLRDWFAGQVLSSILLAEPATFHVMNPLEAMAAAYSFASVRAYMVADAMLEARKGGKS